MSRYYCPFCSSSYQIHKTRSDGVLICGQCEDPLIKRPFITLKTIFGFVAAFAFLAPLLIMIVIVLNDFRREKPPNNSELAVLLGIPKEWITHI